MHYQILNTFFIHNIGPRRGLTCHRRLLAQDRCILGSGCRGQLCDVLDLRALQRLLDEPLGLLGDPVVGQCADLVEQLLLQAGAVSIVLHKTMLVIIVLGLDFLAELQLTQGKDAHLLLLLLDLGPDELHRHPELPIVLSFLLLLLFGELDTFLAEGVDVRSPLKTNTRMSHLCEVGLWDSHCCRFPLRWIYSVLHSWF